MTFSLPVPVLPRHTNILKCFYIFKVFVVVAVVFLHYSLGVAITATTSLEHMYNHTLEYNTIQNIKEHYSSY